MNRFVCRMCVAPAAFVADDVDAIASHTARYHSQIAAYGNKFACCVHDCFTAKTRMSDWLTHVRKCAEREGRTAVQNADPGAVRYRMIFDCHCGEKFVTVDSLKSHLRAHLGVGQPVVCPYPGCNVRIESVRTFHRHLTASHRSDIPAGRMVVDVPGGSDDDNSDSAAPFEAADPRIDVAAAANHVGEEDGTSPPGWYVSLTAGVDRVYKECMALSVCANAQFRVPKTHVRPFFELIETFIASCYQDPSYCDIRGILRQYCNENILDELSAKIMKRIVSHLPLRRTYDRAFSGNRLPSEYRLAKEMKSSMQFVPPVDINSMMVGSVENEDCPIAKGGGKNFILLICGVIFSMVAVSRCRFCVSIAECLR